MDVQSATLILQAVSSCAIAGGFIYAAFQFHNYRKAAHVANFTKLVEMQMEMRRMRVDNPSLARVYKHDVQLLGSDDEIRDYFMNLMQLSIFEVAWFSHRNGQLSDDYFESWVHRMKDIQSEDSFRRMMANPSMKILHDDFQAYIVELMAADKTTPRS